MSRLALVMVARGEADLVERAMRSAQPYVDEIVVLDLGSDDAALARFSEVGAQVVHGRWDEDAARCRNAALDAADADWNLVLDPEEWLAGGAETLHAFTEGPDQVGLIEVRRAPGGAHADDHPRHLSPRLLPRGVRFEGAYREEPVFDLPVVHTELVIESDDTESGRWRADRDRHEALLLQALAVRPGDPGLMHRLADEMRIRGRYIDAADHYATALSGGHATDESRHELVIGALECYTKAGMLREAVALMDAQKESWQHSPDFTFLLGDLFFEMMLTTPDLGHELAPLIRTAWLRCLELGERPDLAGAVHGRGSFLAAQNLYVFHLVLGQNDEAEQWSSRATEMRVPTAGAGRLLG